MATSVALNDALSMLGELMDRAEDGEDIVIERAGRAAMKLVPVSVDTAPSATAPSETTRVGGQNLLGITYLASDFDAPMSAEELKEWGC